MIELTGEQRSMLRDALVELEASLAEILDSTESGTRPVKLKDNIGRLSRMDEMHNQSILKANRNVIANRLKRVRIALKRVDEETYGRCDECDEPIAFARLKAYPDATLCIACQSERENGPE